MSDIRIIRHADGKHVTLVVNGEAAKITIEQWSLLIAKPEKES